MRRHLKKSLILTLVTVLAVFLLFSIQPRIYSFQGQVMGTSYHVSYVSSFFPHLLNNLPAKVHDTLSDVDQRMSTYNPNSELMQFNRAPIGQPYTVSSDIVHLVDTAQSISDMSEGAYDITIGHLVNLFGFGPTIDDNPVQNNHDNHDANRVEVTPQWIQRVKNNGPAQMPDPTAIKTAINKVGYQSLKVDHAKSTLTREKDLFVDLSSIAKGYAVDRAAELLTEQGIENYMVELGGEILVRGVKPTGKRWRLAIMGPEMGKNGFSTLVEPLNKALATSGNYLNYYELNGKRYSHTLNPVGAGLEANRLAEVTVISDTTAQADALATMFMVLGDEKGLELANNQGIAVHFAYYTDSGYKTTTSKAFKPYLITSE